MCPVGAPAEVVIIHHCYNTSISGRYHAQIRLLRHPRPNTCHKCPPNYCCFCFPWWRLQVRISDHCHQPLQQLTSTLCTCHIDDTVNANNRATILELLDGWIVWLKNMLELVRINRGKCHITTISGVFRAPAKRCRLLTEQVDYRLLLTTNLLVSTWIRAHDLGCCNLNCDTGDCHFRFD